MDPIAATLQREEEGEQAKAQESFNETLKGTVALFQQYRDKDSLDAARAVVPLSLLRQRSETAPLCKYHQSSDDPSDHLEEFFRQLMKWFKEDFFRWVTNPLCSHCRSARTVHVGGVFPNPEETMNLASTVEHYQCDDCRNFTRFPRYNRAKRLLTWRQGRCGEWTNCFCLLCVALGYDVRYVLDLTDHVWVEVYLASKRRWVHCDPCENAFDTPSMYEAGWGKSLSYVFAFNAVECVDVTRRYTKLPIERLRGRNIVGESFMWRCVTAIDYDLGMSASENEAALCRHRKSLEMNELIFGIARPRETTEGAAAGGRTTGSEQWRSSRGETGVTRVAVENVASTSVRHWIWNQRTKNFSLLDGTPPKLWIEAGVRVELTFAPDACPSAPTIMRIARCCAVSLRVDGASAPTKVVAVAHAPRDGCYGVTRQGPPPTIPTEWSAELPIRCPVRAVHVSFCMDRGGCAALEVFDPDRAAVRIRIGFMIPLCGEAVTSAQTLHVDGPWKPIDGSVEGVPDCS
jgi:peptide-N4-(N-acetyl-beta-glucosaminyl)asparagine amidase